MVSFLIILFLFGQVFSCFASNRDDVEEYLSALGAKKIQGQKYEAVKDNYELERTTDVNGGIVSYDVAENGDIAVVYGDREFVSIYDSNMNMKHQYKDRVESVLFLDNYILLFSLDYTCALYNTAGELKAIYDLTELKKDNPRKDAYEEYDRITRTGVKEKGGNVYYISNNIESPQYNLGDEKNQYRYLIRADKNGNKTVLIDKKEVFRNKILYIFYFIACAIIILLALNYKYHFIKKLREVTKKAR